MATGRKYLDWPKVNPVILRQIQDERIYFYKALLSKIERTLIEERLIKTKRPANPNLGKWRAQHAMLECG